MDPPQQPRSLKRKSRSPSPVGQVTRRVPPPPGMLSAPQAPSTSLPSIHSLYLGAPQSVPLPVYSEERHVYPPPASMMPMPHPPAMASGGGPPRDMSHTEPIDPYGLHVGDSDPDSGEQGNRPKQKRRRQALSCTECKRRKIKCDRAHPCGPCTRRGDQLKCQWHVIEPVDKYVSRSEYDELRARVDWLEAALGRMQEETNTTRFAQGDLPLGPGAPIFASQSTDRATFSVGGPSRRPDVEPIYNAPELHQHPTQSPVANSAYAASYSHRGSKQRASSPVPPPGLLPAPDPGTGSSPPGYVRSRRPSVSDHPFPGRAGTMPRRSPPVASGSNILPPPLPSYAQSPSRGIASLGNESLEHSPRGSTDMRPSSRRASTASLSGPPRLPSGTSVPQLPPPPGADRQQRYRER